MSKAAAADEPEMAELAESNLAYRLLAGPPGARSYMHRNHIDTAARRLVRAIEATVLAEDKLRAMMRGELPVSFSPTLVPRAEQAVQAYLEGLRQELFEIFNDELDRAIAAERAREGKGN